MFLFSEQYFGLYFFFPIVTLLGLPYRAQANKAFRAGISIFTFAKVFCSCRGTSGARFILQGFLSDEAGHAFCFPFWGIDGEGFDFAHLALPYIGLVAVCTILFVFFPIPLKDFPAPFTSTHRCRTIGIQLSVCPHPLFQRGINTHFCGTDNRLNSGSTRHLKQA